MPMLARACRAGCRCEMAKIGRLARRKLYGLRWTGKSGEIFAELPRLSDFPLFPPIHQKCVVAPVLIRQGGKRREIVRTDCGGAVGAASQSANRRPHRLGITSSSPAATNRRPRLAPRNRCRAGATVCLSSDPTPGGDQPRGASCCDLGCDQCPPYGIVGLVGLDAFKGVSDGQFEDNFGTVVSSAPACRSSDSATTASAGKSA